MVSADCKYTKRVPNKRAKDTGGATSANAHGEIQAAENGNKGEGSNSTVKKVLPNSEKWRIFALVLDRIAFVVFLVALVLSFVWIFPQPMRIFSL